MFPFACSTTRTQSPAPIGVEKEVPFCWGIDVPFRLFPHSAAHAEKSIPAPVLTSDAVGASGADASRQPHIIISARALQASIVFAQLFPAAWKYKILDHPPVVEREEAVVTLPCAIRSFHVVNDRLLINTLPGFASILR
jgi:hypothetical protein